MCDKYEGEKIDAWRHEHGMIERYGWMIQSVIGPEVAGMWAYTIGLAGNFDHPELVVLGIGVNATHLLLNEIGEHIREGRRFDHGDVLVDPDGDLIWLSQVDRGNFDTGLLGIWGAYYEALGPPYPEERALEVVLPGREPVLSRQLPLTDGRLPANLWKPHNQAAQPQAMR